MGDSQKSRAARFAEHCAYAGSELSVSGGFWGDNFDADASSSVHIYGGEFRIDGVPIAGLETGGSFVAVNVPAGAVLSGTLADGTSVAYSSQNFDTFADGTLTLRAAALPPPGPTTYQVPADAAPTGLRQGQSLVLGAGDSLASNFTAALGSSVTITGGSVAKNFEAVGASVAISGGFVTSSFDAFRGSVVNITGGVVSGMACASWQRCQCRGWHGQRDGCSSWQRCECFRWYG